MTLDEIKRLNLIDYARDKLSIDCNDKGMAHCPFHVPDKTPSFSIYEADDGIWRWTDFHDGSNGTIIDLKAMIERKSSEEAIRDLLQISGSAATKYGGTDRRVLRFHIYKDKDGTPIFKKVKYASGEPPWSWFHPCKDGWVKGKGSAAFVPYNLSQFSGYKSVVVCEGEKDADTVMSLEAVLATSAPNGKGSWPDEITPYFRQFDDLFFLYDVGNEEDVTKHANKLHRAFPQMRIHIARVPLEKTEADISDYLSQVEDKWEAFGNILKRAETIDFDVPAKQVKNNRGRRLRLLSLDKVIPKPSEFLWPDRIPLGKLSMISGDPGQGKSFLALFLAKHVTTGKPWPDCQLSPRKGSVVLISAEDGISDTIRIRAEAMGVDLSKIKCLDGVITDHSTEDVFDLSIDAPALEAALVELGDTHLIIIDPITSYMGDTNTISTSKVRGCLMPLVKLAEKYGVAIVMISHLNKKEESKSIYRTTESLAFVAVARAAWLVGPDRNDPTGERKLFLPQKINLVKNPGGLAFRISDNGLVVFEREPIRGDVDELLSNGTHATASSLSEAVDWLSQVLAEGPLPSSEVYSLAEKDRIPEHALIEAKRKLRIRPRKRGFGPAGQWVMELPGVKNDEADSR